MNLDPVDSLRLMLMDKINAIHTALLVLVTVILFGFVMLAMVLIKILDRLAVD